MVQKVLALFCIFLVCVAAVSCGKSSGGSSGSGGSGGNGSPSSSSEGGEEGLPGDGGTGSLPNTPSPPSILMGRSLAQLVWLQSADATKYHIYRDGSLVASVTDSLYYFDTSLILGTAYTYELSAFNASGESGKSVPVTATTAIWTKVLCSSSKDYASGIALDTAGNFYVVGWTAGNLDGQTNAGGKDIFITKYDPSGMKQWTKLLGTSVDEEATSVAVDSSGYIYVTGYTDGNLDGQANAGKDDIFIAKYDGAGTKQWVQVFGTPGNEWANGIAVDSSGYIYVTGYTDGNLDGQANAGKDDILVGKFDTSGTRQWVSLLGTAVEDVANGIAVDDTGLYITGWTAGNLDGQTNAGGKDIFVAAYTQQGTKQWVQLLGTATDDAGNAISLVPGGIGITGYTGNNLDGQTNAGGKDIFVAAYTQQGTKQWVRLIGSNKDDSGKGIALDLNGNSYIAGYTWGDVGGAISCSGTGNAGKDDIFIVKYDPSGVEQWTRLLGTAASDGASALALDIYQNSYIVGYTAGSLDGVPNTDSDGAFIAKVTSNGIVW
ncbi:MAG: Beta-propeller repeat protein [Syntrophorhabdaceae bacterium PtaU1.Bin034]|nr:MAG: Beta-propeller repeat protein [Syntrophorhabdaceae bacterium PtaU1.Bin034]